MKRLLFRLFVTGLVTAVIPMTASAMQYISAEEVKQNIQQQTPMTLIDIQVEEEFNKHHIAGAVPTYAFPAKTASDRAKLDPIVEQLRTSDEMAVIVCPRGGGGAKNTYEYLLESGIASERLYVLTKGQAAWPYPELLEQNR